MPFFSAAFAFDTGDTPDVFHADYFGLRWPDCFFAGQLSRLPLRRWSLMLSLMPRHDCFSLA